MVKISFRKKAVEDLNSIWNHTYENWSETQADIYYATIKFACNGIKENPNIGKEYDGISKNLLGLKAGEHIIFYRLILDDEIEIIRILHERMDLKNRLTE